jgi:hypothetical protein
MRPARSKAQSADLTHAIRMTLMIGFAVVATAILIFAMAAPAFAGGSGGMGGGSLPSSTPSKPKGPTDTRAYKDAVKHINKEEYDDAITLLKALNSVAPGDADVLNYLGYVNRQLDKDALAMAYYGEALEIKPRHKGANEYLGELYLKTGDLEKAEAQLELLDDICTFGCSEFRDLRDKIAEFKTAQSS